LIISLLWPPPLSSQKSPLVCSFPLSVCPPSFPVLLLKLAFFFLERGERKISSRRHIFVPWGNQQVKLTRGGTSFLLARGNLFWCLWLAPPGGGPAGTLGFFGFGKWDCPWFAYQTSSPALLDSPYKKTWSFVLWLIGKGPLFVHRPMFGVVKTVFPGV